MTSPSVVPRLGLAHPTQCPALMLVVTSKPPSVYGSRQVLLMPLRAPDVTQSGQ